MNYTPSMRKDIYVDEIISDGYESNTFVVSTDTSAIIFDAGAKVEDISERLGGKKVLSIFITHSHFDHILHLDDYISQYNVPVYISSEGASRLKDETKNLSTMFLNMPIIVGNSAEIICPNDDECINIGDIEVHCISTTGHSDCSMTYVVNDKYAFVGDVLFRDGIGRYDFFDGNYGKLFNSIKRIKRLNVEKYFSGHGISFEK